MRVLADLHHSDLYYSLQLLFEHRLGWELYRPIGTQWHTDGYWKVYNHPATVQQYLGTGTQVPVDVHGYPLEKRSWLNKSFTIHDGIYYINDPTKNRINRGITLDVFKDLHFDVLISSIPGHIEPFNTLIRKYHPQAKHIFQIGNSWSLNQNVPNIMASCAPPAVVPADKNVVFYHQEFDLDTFSYTGPSDNPKSMASFIHYMRQPQLARQVVQDLGSDWTLRMFGAGMSEGGICKSSDIAEAIRSTGFIWHYKPGGDGFGHILHNAFAMGRPIITRGSDYAGKLGGDLLVEGQTYLDTAAGPLAPRLEEIVATNKYSDMCQNCYNKFKSVVNYDAEFEEIKVFLNNLR